MCRAAIESCAENFSDGVVAPVFWLALLGLPGLIAYKAINTADSMIGHLSPRYASFGWAAARLDDLVNLIPARLSGLLIAVVAPVARGTTATALKVMWRDAAKHRSPNAGWPESATAGALGLALAGPRRYGERIVDDAFLNAEARKDATPRDIGRALDLLIAACLLRGRGLRRARAGRLTAARDFQDPLDVEMRFQVVGERVQCRFYAGFVGQRRRNAELREPRLAKGVTGEQAVHIGALHAAIGRDGAVGTTSDRQHRPHAVAAFAPTEMDLVAPQWQRPTRNAFQ